MLRSLGLTLLSASATSAPLSSPADLSEGGITNDTGTMTLPLYIAAPGASHTAVSRLPG